MLLAAVDLFGEDESACPDRERDRVARARSTAERPPRAARWMIPKRALSCRSLTSTRSTHRPDGLPKQSGVRRLPSGAAWRRFKSRAQSSHWLSAPETLGPDDRETGVVPRVAYDNAIDSTLEVRDDVPGRGAATFQSGAPPTPLMLSAAGSSMRDQCRPADIRPKHPFQAALAARAPGEDHRLTPPGGVPTMGAPPSQICAHVGYLSTSVSGRLACEPVTVGPALLQASPPTP